MLLVNQLLPAITCNLLRGLCVLNCKKPSSQQLSLEWSAVAAREQVLRPSLEGLGTRDDKAESIGQPTGHVE